jgi:hemoglobin/transferrin/lactoferrin receptor protein
MGASKIVRTVVGFFFVLMVSITSTAWAEEAADSPGEGAKKGAGKDQSASNPQPAADNEKGDQKAGGADKDPLSNADGAQLDEETALGEVVVTATRTDEATTELPQAISVVTREEIERRQARTPNQMLREEPGVWSVQVTSQGSPIIRGQIGNRILYLWDGVRINNGALFGGPNGFFNQFPVGAVDRIEVIRGPGAVQYGSDAIGGVINVITRGVEFTDKLQYGGEAYARYGSTDNERTETFDLHLTNKKVAFAGGFSRQDVDDFHAGGGEGKQDPSGYSATGGYANVKYQPIENHTVKVSWVQNQRDDIESYVQSRLNASGVPRIFGPSERRGIVKFDYDIKDLAPIVSKDFKFYAYDQYYDALRDRRVESTTTFTNTRTTTDQDVWGTGAQNTAEFGPHQLTYGLDYRLEDLGTSLFQSARNKATNVVANSHPRGNTPDGTYDVFDAFVEGQFKPIDCLVVSAGARFEHTHIDSDPEQLDVIPNAGYDVGDLTIDKSWNSATWSVGAVFGVTKDLDLAGNIATGFRAPTFSDLLSAGPPVFASKIASVPSPDLDPEQSITYELGPRYHSRRVSASFTAYWTQLNDVISSQVSGTVDIPGQGTFSATRNSNASHGYNRGLEFAFSYEFIDDFSLFGNATYTRSQDKSIDEPFRFAPPLFGIAGLRYESPSKRWWVEGVEMFADKLRRHAPNDELDAGFSRDPALGSPNTTNNLPLRSDFKLPGWAITNLRAGVTAWKKDHRSFDLTLDVYNVFDTRYREAYSQQQKFAPGINAVIGGRLKF